MMVNGKALSMVADCNAPKPPTTNKIMDKIAINAVQNRRCHIGEFSVFAVK